MAQVLYDKINSEIKKAKNELKPSIFNEMSNGSNGQSEGMSPLVEHLLNLKADKKELNELFN